MAKLFASDMAMKVTTTASSLLGATGTSPIIPSNE